MATEWLGIQGHQALLPKGWRTSIQSKRGLPLPYLVSSSQTNTQGHRPCPLAAFERLLQARTVRAARPASWRAANQSLFVEGRMNRKVASRKCSAQAHFAHEPKRIGSRLTRGFSKHENSAVSVRAGIGIKARPSRATAADA